MNFNKMKKSEKSILILCDADDCIRHEGNDTIMLKQLYSLVFIIENISKTRKIHLQLNNRAIFDFDVYWKEDCSFKDFLSKYTTNEDWENLELSLFDIIICHPLYQAKLTKLLEGCILKNLNQQIFCFKEYQYQVNELFPAVGALFSTEGEFELGKDEKFINNLNEFKISLHQGFKKFSIQVQEQYIIDLPLLVEKNNILLKRQSSYKRIIILDDFKRSFFIGDSIFWMGKLRKLISLLDDNVEVILNVNNQTSYRSICRLFNGSLPERIDITADDWDHIKFDKFDAIFCQNDILLKFKRFFDRYYKNKTALTSFFSFSVLDEVDPPKQSELSIYKSLYNLNYFEILKSVNEQKNKNVYLELSLTGGEEDDGECWYLKSNILKNEDVFILIHGASARDKIISDFEVLKLVKLLNSNRPNLKIVILTHNLLKENSNLFYKLKGEELNGKIVLGDSLSFRMTMAIMGNSRVKCILGPCTGHMHIANSIYTYKINNEILNEDNLPLMITYAGRQVEERRYHPSFWWNYTSFVNCAVIMKNSEMGDYLIGYSEMPKTIEDFEMKSEYASKISSEMLIEYIKNTRPSFFSLGIMEYKNQRNLLGIFAQVERMQVKERSMIQELLEHLLDNIDKQTDFNQLNLLNKSFLTKKIVGPYSKYIIVDTPNGDVAVDINDSVVGQELRTYGEFEKDVLTILKKIVNSKTNILILGAHIGTHIVQIFRDVNKIFAIEANPETFKLLELNVKLNKISNCQLLHCALAEKTGYIPFLVSTVNSGGSKRKPLKEDSMYYFDNPKEILIPSFRVDDALDGNFNYDVVLMDIEGSEYFALQGMIKTLKHVNVLIMEFIPHHLKNIGGISPIELIYLLEEFNFLFVPSLNKKVVGIEILNILDYMFEHSMTDDSLVFSKIPLDI